MNKFEMDTFTTVTKRPTTMTTMKRQRFKHYRDTFWKWWGGGQIM